MIEVMRRYAEHINRMEKELGISICATSNGALFLCDNENKISRVLKHTVDGYELMEREEDK